jgi:hypothetical protein
MVKMYGFWQEFWHAGAMGVQNTNDSRAACYWRNKSNIEVIRNKFTKFPAKFGKQF